MSAYTCPKCSNKHCIVIESRPTKSTGYKRRRKCLGCEYRFTTYENMVVSRTGSSESPGTAVQDNLNHLALTPA